MSFQWYDPRPQPTAREMLDNFSRAIAKTNHERIAALEEENATLREDRKRLDFVLENFWIEWPKGEGLAIFDREQIDAAMAKPEVRG